MEATPAERNYNFIYRSLVEDPNDLVGVIAYAQYKQQKIEWIDQFNNVHKRNPSDIEIDQFHSTTNTETALKGYRLQAKEILDGFLATALEEATKEISDAYNAQLEGEYKNIENSHKNAARSVLAEFKKEKFWTGVWQEIIANIVVILLGAILLIFVWSLKHSLGDVIADSLGYAPKVSEKPQPR